MANRVRVQILGNVYYVNTNGAEEHIHEIEQKVSQALDDIMEGRQGLSNADALVMLSLNLMDELTENEASTDRMREQLSQYLEDAAHARMALDDEKREANRLRREIESLRKVEESFRVLQEEKESLQTAVQAAHEETARLRAEMERQTVSSGELAAKVDSLSAENGALRRDIENLLS